MSRYNLKELRRNYQQAPSGLAMQAFADEAARRLPSLVMFGHPSLAGARLAPLRLLKFGRLECAGDAMDAVLSIMDTLTGSQDQHPDLKIITNCYVHAASAILADLPAEQVAKPLNEAVASVCQYRPRWRRLLRSELAALDGPHWDTRYMLHAADRWFSGLDLVGIYGRRTYGYDS